MVVAFVAQTHPEIRHGLPGNFRRAGQVDAIAFDMDIEALRTHYGDSYNNAYLEIRRVLQRHGFAWQQGSVYCGGETVTVVTCVLAAQDLARSPGSRLQFPTHGCCGLRN